MRRYKGREREGGMESEREGGMDSEREGGMKRQEGQKEGWRDEQVGRDRERERER